MPWLLTLHITALLGWCGALLYLPALMVATQQPQSTTARHPDSAGRAATPQPKHFVLPRVVYCWIATPTALATILAGTLVFFHYRIFELWLIFKLALVTLLVILHLLAGLLIARAEQGHHQHLRGSCYAIAALSFATITAILWLVLAKPLREF